MASVGPLKVWWSKKASTSALQGSAELGQLFQPDGNCEVVPAFVEFKVAAPT
jgi:hypothetical protein